MQKKEIKKKKVKFIVYLMFFLFFFVFLFWMFFSVFWIKENKLIFGGSSSVFPLMVNLKNLNNKKLEKYTYISSGSSAAIWGVVTEKFDIGFVSKEFSNDKLKELFKDTTYKITDLKKFKLADDKIIFLVNLPNGCKGEEINFLNSDIQEIYKGEKTWNSLNGVTCNDETKYIKIKPFNRQEGSGTRSVFENKFMKGVDYQDIKILKSGSAIFKYIFNNHGSFGYISESKIISNKNLIKNKKNIIIPRINNIFFEENSYEFKRPFIGLYLKNNFKKLEKFLNFLKNNSKKQINDLGYHFKWEYIND